MTRWFRFYDDALNDPKVQRLPAPMFKFWVNLLCIASKNEGKIPGIEDVAFSMRLSDTDATEFMRELTDAGLIDDDGGGASPHNWTGRQFKSDGSTERVKRFREARVKRDTAVPEAAGETLHETVVKCYRNVSETAGETGPEQSRADTEKKDSGPIGPPETEPFDEFWEAYPKRDGSNPRKPALVSFRRAIARGATPAVIVAGARALAAQHPTRTPFVPQAVTWLNQERWTDVEAVATGPPNGVLRVRTVEEIFAEVDARHEQSEAISRH